MFRKILFWLHLASGVVAGLVIAVMSITGVALTFQPQMLEWKRSDLRNLTPPAGVERLPLEQIVARVQAQHPDAKPTAVTVPTEPNAAVVVRYGRDPVVFASPWTGDVLPDPAASWDSFFRTMVAWHRWLGAEGENRETGKAITGISNAAFLVLALTGMVLWIPRRWAWKAIRPVLWFRRGVSGKARDFNWHNVIGLWTLPVLVVLTATAMVISYGWASDLLYRFHGEEPVRGRPGPPTVDVPTPAPDARRMPLDGLLAAASSGAGAESLKEVTVALGKPGDAVQFTLRERNPWPAFSSHSVALDPYTGGELLAFGFADHSPARRLRWWARFLHTGEALGWPGQLVAGVASLGGVFLVWTGFALSWRRLTAWLRRRSRAAASVASSDDRARSEAAAPTS